MGYIYKTTNTLNNKIYIGRAISKRLCYVGGGIRINRAVKKYGRENFIKEILEDDIEDNDLLNEREMYWISLFNSTNENIGYNITNGGSGLLGLIHTPEARIKISEASKNRIWTQESRDRLSRSLKGKYAGVNSPNYGKPVSQETKDKISGSLKGIPLTPERRANIIKSLEGKINHNYGKPMPQETKDKISKAHKGVCLSEAHRDSMSKARKGIFPSQETKDKMSEAHKGERHHMYGKHHSQESKDKMSESRKGTRMGVLNHNYGRIFTQEERDKMSKAHIGIPLSQKHRESQSKAQIARWQRIRKERGE